MGKEITYSAQTNFRQYAVRLRALVDNPRNPAELGAIGSDWAVDDPSAIVEEGSNSNGSYELYAGGEVELNLKAGTWGTVPGNATRNLTKVFPIVLSNTSYKVFASDYSDTLCGPRFAIRLYTDKLTQEWDNRYNQTLGAGYIYVKIRGSY